MIQEKRGDLLIDAFNQIAGQRPTWDLVMVGDGLLRQAWQQRVRPDLASRVIWTGFRSDSADVAAIYRYCDALVLPSDYEPWALVVNEAAAAGLALICSHVVGAAAELLQDGVNGRSFAAGDLNALRDAIFDVTDDRHIEAYKSRSHEILMDWRRRGDPIEGLNSALCRAGVVET